MTTADQLFIEILQAGIRGSRLPEKLPMPDELQAWEALFVLAEEQELLPLAVDVIYRSSAWKNIDKELLGKYKEHVLKESIRRIVQTKEFLTLILHAQACGLDPVVIKGITVGELYPKPYLRLSVDDDLFIDSEDTERFHKFFVLEGLFSDDPDADLASVSELSYHKENSPLYIELHKTLFPADSEAYGDLNALFEGALTRTQTIQIEDVTLRVLAPTDHILYLLCHAYKHFLHSGVGIRHISDMALFINAYDEEIDWNHIYQACSSVSIETFAAAVFKIAHKYLTLKSVPASFARIDIDEEPLLEDVLTGGLYGTADIDRAHSVNITLAAAAADKEAGTRTHFTRRGLLKSLFPGVHYLQNMFPYAKEHPVLTPVAWAHRIVNYLKRRGRKPANPVKSIQIGRSRVELMKKYKIIK